MKSGKVIIFHKTTHDAGKEQITKQNPTKIQIIDKLYYFNRINIEARAQVRIKLLNQVIMHEF